MGGKLMRTGVFTCTQLPESVTKKRRGCNKKIVCCDGNLEEDCPISEPPRKRRTKRGTAWKDCCREITILVQIYLVILLRF